MNFEVPIQPQWLRANTLGFPIGVDRANRVIRGYVVAERGPFKTPGRGEFDDVALESIANQINQTRLGIKSRFAHPTLSDDGIGTFLGRTREAIFSPAEGKVRANLYFDPTASFSPKGDLANYVMSLAESDPASFGSSLVLQVDKKYRLNERGERITDSEGNELPPLWYPKKLHASDIVDEGDAVHGGFLSINNDKFVDVDNLRDSLLWKACAVLDRVFEGQSREVVESRCLNFLNQYLNRRYGEKQKVRLDIARKRLRLKEF